MKELVFSIFVILIFLPSCDSVDPYPPEVLETIPEEISNGSFALIEPDHIATGSSAITFIESHGAIRNLTGANLNVSWEKKYIDAPQGWNYSMCDPEVCYLPFISGASFTLIGDSTGLMDMRFYPANTIGEGEGAIFVWLTNDSAASVLEMKFSVLAE